MSSPSISNQRDNRSYSMPREMSSRPTLGVVIPSYCSPHLNRVLAALQKVPVEEVVVVDSSPEEPQFQGPAVSLMHLGERVPAATARNIGAKSIRADYILFLDSDVLLADGAREVIVETLESSRADVVCGLYRHDPWENGRVEELQIAVLRYRLSGVRNPSMVMGSSSHMLVRREVFGQVGGFNPEIDSYEDFEFSARCIKSGFSVEVVPEFEAVHLKRFSVFSLLQDYFRKSYKAVLVRRRYPLVFKGLKMNLGATVVGSWVAAILLPLALLDVAVRPNAGIVDVGLLVGLFIYLLLAGRVIFSDTRRGVKTAALIVWPLVAWSVVAGSLAGLSVWFGRKTKTLFQSCIDWIRLVLRIVIRRGMPVQIVHYVTARCNLRCEHCFYKETLDAPNPGEMSLETLEKTMRGIGPVLWYSLAGGEPFLRNDLADIIGLAQTRCRPKVFSFPTNGWFIERTFSQTLSSLQRMDRGNLILFFSLDGPEEIHDMIRGENSYSRVVESFERLRPLQRLYPNLYLNVVTTVTPDNASVMPAFVSEVLEDLNPNALSINLFRYHSLSHPTIPAEVIDAYEETTRIYTDYLIGGNLDHYGFFGGKVLAIKEVIQKELILEVARNDTFVTPCTAGSLSYVINEDGSVAACEILETEQNLGQLSGTQRSGSPLGEPKSGNSSVTVAIGRKPVAGNGSDSNGEVSFRSIVRSERAKELRSWIRDTECRCTYECAMSTNTLFSWPLARSTYLRMLQNLLTRKGRGLTLLPDRG